MIIKRKEVSIILPTYNEAGNLPLICKKINEKLNTYFYEIIIVDDNSPDGTGEVAKKLAKKYPIKLLKRWQKCGLASAVMLGFCNANSDILICMDSDLQHDPEDVLKLVETIKKGYDIVIGSRYISNSNIDRNWNIHRHWISMIATTLARCFTNVKDPMSGFFAIRSNILEKIKRWDLIGYKILFEILVKTSNFNIKLTEIPIQFGIRKYGKTKLDIKEIFSFVFLLYRLSKWKIREIFNRKIKKLN